MANNVSFRAFRTSTAGKQPNVTNSANGIYINPGEFALNMTDQILYTSNGSVLIYVGSNQVNMSVTNSLSVSNTGGTVTINPASINVAAGATSYIYIGNSTVNATINSTSLTFGGIKTPTSISVATFFPGLPANNAIIRVVVAANCSFPASLTGSQSYCKNLATSSANVVMNYINSGSSTAVANIAFGTVSHNPTFNMTAGLSVFTGDVLEFAFPAIADATLSDICITLLGTVI